MKLISHLDPSQLRLGYLALLAIVAGRQLDTRQALIDRFSRLAFQPIDPHDPRWPSFMSRADQSELERTRSPIDERTAALHELFRVQAPTTPSYQLQVLWLAQRSLPSHLGLLAPKNAEHILEMARSFEILTAGYALSEKGVFLQNLLAEVAPGMRDGSPAANPFDLNARRALPLFYLYALLSVDILTPFLLHAFASADEGDPANSPRLIHKAADHLVQVVERKGDITNAEDIRECRTLATRLMRKGVAKNQAQPRYHHLFELGLLHRGEPGSAVLPYLPNENCRRAAQVLSPLRERPDEQQDLLDNCFFGWTVKIFQLQATPCQSDTTKLLYFAKGFPYLEREIGFTPGRTVALAGCLLALEAGWRVEIAEMFALLQRMAAGPWRPYLEYSGGSRLDQEFLIKVKPGLVPALQRDLETQTRERCTQ